MDGAGKSGGVAALRRRSLGRQRVRSALALEEERLSPRPDSVTYGICDLGHII